ncbi:glycine cleavage system T protein (aminomethyltransferase) [Aminobacter sp. Y103A]|uniref:aminomethyltransferase family protein n=1 Tax=Aminobacter sp. Y103A TaxID=1870862 RepID=UPI0025728A5D|nr:aminomethyltransferase family protein [Aminobacter sp. SS-2016]BBD37468.1 glycine cleavage system T protein (aminomethyltransferase) [Aminobacter sp. SS-2016]
MQDKAELAGNGTPFHAATSAEMRTTWWYQWDKYIVPDVYTSMPQELAAIRNAVAMIDMSPLPKMELRGPDAHRLVDRLMTRDMTRLAVDHVMYAPWCNRDGLLVGDGLVFRLADDWFIVSGETSHAWFASQAGGLQVTIRNASDDYGILSLQGPRAFDLMQAATGRDWSGLKFSQIGRAVIAGHDILVARQGFTGELGFELWVPRAAGAAVWRELKAVGQPFGVLPAGEYAVDVARIEAGLILVSADYNGAGPDPRTARVDVTDELNITPIEAGLGRLIDFGSDFVGKQALQAAAAEPGRRFVGLHYDASAIVTAAAENSAYGTALSRVYWGSMPIFHKGTSHAGKPVGRASSLAFSPTLKRAISFAFLPAELSSPGTVVDVELKDDDGAAIGRVTATVVSLPFIEIRRSKG